MSFKTAAGAIVSVMISLMISDPAFAQLTPRDGVMERRQNSMSEGMRREMQDRDRLRDQQRMQDDLVPGRRRARDHRGRELSPAEVREGAQAAAAAANIACNVSDSALLGATNDDADLFEVACDSGAGYVLTTATPPQIFDCLMLSAQAEQMRAAGRDLPANSTCTLPGNQNALAMISSHARDAGVGCQVDAGAFVGATAEGNLVYEVGCSGADGYHLEKVGQGWKKTDCLQIMSSGLQCQFTTSAEQASGFKLLLAGTSIDDCDAQQIRLMGKNGASRFVEVKCGSGEGYVAQMMDEAVTQIYPCSRAQRIGGGCTLTTVEAVTEENSSGGAS